MTEYDYSPEAYERFIQTQSRVVNWVHHTERHRQGFESAAPGAPGVPPVLRQSSPPVQEPCMHKPPLPHSMVPIYHRIPPLPSEDSYVHVPPPQMRRLRPPPPKYIPPMPLHTAFPVHASPAVVRVKDSRLSSSSSRHHHLRVATHSHPYHPPPVMTSPETSLFIPPPPIIAMSSQGHPSSTVARPVNVSLSSIWYSPFIWFMILFCLLSIAPSAVCLNAFHVSSPCARSTASPRHFGKLDLKHLRPLL